MGLPCYLQNLPRNFTVSFCHVSETECRLAGLAVQGITLKVKTKASSDF